MFTDFLLTADQIRQIAFDAVTGHWLPTVFTAHFAPNEYTIKFAPGEGGQDVYKRQGQATSVGNSDDLMIWYDTSVNVPSDITTYTFDPTHLGSVMADNRNIWWTVAKKDTTSVADASVEDKANLLRIGLIGNSKSHATSMLGPNLPWKQALGSVSFWNNVIGFATDGTNGNVAPTTMSQWFASTPAAFTSFDGTYLDTSNVTSFYQAFYNATKLATVTGTGNWNTNKCVNFDSMFQGCSVLKELDIRNWKVRGLSLIHI